MTRLRALLLLVACFAVVNVPAQPGEKKDDGGVSVDEKTRTIKIDAKIAPRKLPHLAEIYPLEVVACWPHPKGKKAHETVVIIDAKPSAVHEALVKLGLKPGTPVMGGKDVPQGPEVKLYLEIPDGPAATKRVSIDKTMVDNRTGKAFPKTVTWRFTGSVQSKPDPNLDKTVYGADLSGTLIVIFPVSDQTVLQTNLTMEYERFMKLELNTKLLPAEGTPVKLVIEAPPAP
jgi:hypothetical protein